MTGKSSALAKYTDGFYFKARGPATATE